MSHKAHTCVLSTSVNQMSNPERQHHLHYTLVYPNHRAGPRWGESEWVMVGACGREGKHTAHVFGTHCAWVTCAEITAPKTLQRRALPTSCVHF